MNMVQRRGSVFGAVKSVNERFHVKEEVTIVDYSVSDEDLLKVFNTYAGQHEENGGMTSLNPLQFSSIWRLVSGEKGNLYKEMQMFNK